MKVMQVLLGVWVAAIGIMTLFVPPFGVSLIVVGFFMMWDGVNGKA